MPLDTTPAAPATTMTEREIEMFLRRSLSEAIARRRGRNPLPDDIMREVVWDLQIDLRDKGLAIVPRQEKGCGHD